MNEAGEVDGSSIVARRETAEMLEAAEASLDPIALLVEFGVVGDEDLAVALGRDHRLCFHLSDHLSQLIAIICFVGEYGIRFLAFEQGWSGGDVMSLPCRDGEA